MRLLICTQVMDSEHSILGFFHRWVEEFAKHCEVVHVICLQEGRRNLPTNVHVHSLGKEIGENRLKYLWRFYTYAWKFRHEYDYVFVHMNQVYVLLGALLWRMQRKRIGLWYMHGSVTSALRLAERLTHIVFSGSRESFRIDSKKLVVTGHGIDTDHFAPQDVKKDIDLITVGRITPSKNLEAVLDALQRIRMSRDVSLTIVGAPTTAAEQHYQEQVIGYTKKIGVANAVHWYGSVPQTELPRLLNRAKVFVHTAQNGSLDKAILEAAACGVPVVSTASVAKDISFTSDAAVLADTIEKMLQSDFVNSIARDTVIAKHSVSQLIPKIIQYYGLPKAGR